MRNSRKCIALSLIFALIVIPFTTDTNHISVSAAKKVKLSVRKITILKGKTRKIKVKGAKGKKVKWKIKKKSIASIKKSGKYAVKVKALKKGKTRLTCKVKTGRKWKSFKCTVTVSNPKKEDNTTTNDSGISQDGDKKQTDKSTSIPTNGSSTNSSVQPSASPSDRPLTSPSARPSASPSARPLTSPSVRPSVSPSARPLTSPSVQPSVSPSSEPTPEPTPTAFVPSEYKSAGFESGTEDFTARGGCKLTVVDGGHTGKALSVTGRQSTWNGAALDVTETVDKGAVYKFSAWVKHNENEDKSIKLSMELKAPGQDTTWPEITQTKCKSGEWTYIEGKYTVPEQFETLTFYFEGPDGMYDFLVDDLVITQETQGIEVLDPNQLPSLKDAYNGIFERFGNVLSYNTSWNNGYQMQSKDTMQFAQRQFNSYTLENEMKPDALLSAWSGTISVSEAKQMGYVIPDSYQETKVAKLNFDSLDKILELSDQYGIQMRAHVLMWHQQTATRFFKTDYSDTGSVVSPKVMDARIQFFVSSVMKHVMEKEKQLTGKVGSIVYCWDVTNEYIHRTNDPTATSWMDVYGDMGLQPTYVKLAYRTAYNMLKQYGVEQDITLFYNDYNEYDCADDIVKLVTYINEGEAAKICGGIGMQSHITVSYPTLGKYEEAVDKFLATGLQVQVTELDMGIDADKTEADQAKHYSDLLTMLINKQKNLDKSVNSRGITGVTIWGLYDTLSWRKASSPLLFGTGLSDPKEAFYSVIEAAKQ